jgi:hypothetical protein
MTCAQAQRQIERMVEESDLKETERSLLALHLKNCADCKARLNNYRRLEVRVKEAFAAVDTGSQFNRRLMNTLRAQKPDGVREETPAEAETRFARHGTGRAAAVQRRHWLRVYRVPVAVALLICIGLGGAWIKHGFGSGSKSDAPPVMTVLSGSGYLVRGTSGRTPLTNPHALQPGETLTAADMPLVVLLHSGGEIGKLVIAPGSEITAQNRHTYTLLRGKAYFEVNKNRPGAGSENFDVHAAELAHVQVTGTIFAVDLSAATGPRVLVKEGVVRVATKKHAAREIVANQELQLAGDGLVRIADVGSQLSWIEGRTPKVLSVSTEGPIDLPTESAQTPELTAPEKPFNWDAEIKSVTTAGLTLAQGLELLGAATGSPSKLRQLVKQANELVPDEKLSFSIHNPLTLKLAIAWMARDCGLRLDAAEDPLAARLLIAPEEQPMGEAKDGELPQIIRNALDVSAPNDFAGPLSFAELTQRLSARCGVSIIVSRHCSCRQLPAQVAENSTVAQALDKQIDRFRLNMAWYDGVLFIDYAWRIEELTTVMREISCAQLVGRPFVPRFGSDLKMLLEAETYPATLPLVRVSDTWVGRSAFSNIAFKPLEDGSALLSYKSGMAGRVLMRQVLDTYAAPSAAVLSAASILSHNVDSGPVADLESLLKEARQFTVIETKVVSQPFSKQAFVNRNLGLGQALEWGAWISGLGVRQEQDGLVIDDALSCHGLQQTQVLSLAAITALRPELATRLPEVFSRHLPALYPTFLGNIHFHCLNNLLVFNGDRRQLLLAQRLAKQLEIAISADAEKTLDPQKWLPPWRAQIDKNLAERFRNSGENNLNGSFVGLLRNSSLSAQLHCTVLVDPRSMKEKAALEIKNLHVANATVGDVLTAMASAAGLKMVIEGEVVWLRP